MNICVLDDSKYTLDTINKMISQACEELNIVKPHVFMFTIPDDFIDWYNTNSNTIDVIFLDINLKNNIDGLKIAKLIKDANYHILIVFMTGYDNYFPDIVQVEPFRFLSKPLEYEKFYQIFQDVYNRLILKKSEEQKPIYMCKNNGITFAINLNDAIYFSSYKRKIYVHCKNNFNVEFYGKLDSVEKDIHSLSNKYIRINKSYLFNKDFVENISKNSISVEGVTYTISPKYRDKIKLLHNI